MTRFEWFWAILFIIVAIFIALLPALGHADRLRAPSGIIVTPSYRLYIYNMDTKNYYAIRIKNEDNGWQANLNIEAGSCESVERMEPGWYTIRTYRDGRNSGAYELFEVTDDHLCIEIDSVTGALRPCNKTFCD